MLILLWLHLVVLLWSVIHQHSTRSNKVLAPPWTSFLETHQFNVYPTEGVLFVTETCVSGGASFFSAECFFNGYSHCIRIFRSQDFKFWPLSVLAFAINSSIGIYYFLTEIIKPLKCVQQLDAFYRLFNQKGCIIR